MLEDDSGAAGDDRSKTKDQLVAELGQLRQVILAVVESSDDAIVGTTIDGIITTWNAGAERILGYSAAEAIGQPVAILFGAELQDDAPRILERLRAGGGVDRFDAVRIAKDGKRHHLCVTISPLRNSSGQVTGASQTGRDTTELRAALEAAESARKAAEWANQAKEHFLDLLSHELRTPLTPVLASVGHIEATTDLTEELRSAMEVIRRNVEMEVRLALK